MVDQVDGDESTVVDISGDRCTTGVCRRLLAGELDQQCGDTPLALAGVEICSPNSWSVTASFFSMSASQSASAWSLLVTSTFSLAWMLPMAFTPETLFETRF